MKRLTLNRISAASIRFNRRSYISLTFGIMLAVFLATVVTLCSYGILQSKAQEIIDVIGTTDCVLFDEPEIRDETLRDSGLFDAVGKQYVIASIKDSEIYLGYTDEAGQAILCRSCVEGRMPEQPGEIAIERSALEKLRLEAELGDTVTWTLQIVDGAEEERSFTVVGILSEQSSRMDVEYYYQNSGAVLAWPSVAIAPEEAFGTGRTVIHRVMCLAPTVSFARAKESPLLEEARFMAISRTQGELSFSDPTFYDREQRLTYIGMLLLEGGALLLCTCIGISSAMESVLSAKTEEIGMLRAVGATRRQIRRIFGRDAWLIAALTLPVGIALGILAYWLLCRVSPGGMLFVLRAWLLLPVIVISAFCVFVSSALPLRRASKQMPMGVLRDTALLRKAKRFKSKRSFRATDLIARRQMSVHPLRQLGASVMVAATLICSAFVGEMTIDTIEELHRSRPTAFSMIPENSFFPTYQFSAVEPAARLSAQDLAQIRALPTVERVSLSGYTTADLLWDGPMASYLLPFGATRFEAHDGESSIVYNILSDLDSCYLSMDESTPRPAATAEGEEADPDYASYLLYQQMRAAMDAQNLIGKPVNLPIYVLDLEDADFSERVAAGKVDLSAVDAGEQILLYAPTVYVYELSPGLLISSCYKNMYGSAIPPVLTLTNDCFHVGQSLSLAQLINGEKQVKSACDDPNEAYSLWREEYSAFEKREATVSVGAILDNKPLYSQEVCLITTEKGAQALGLEMTQLLDMKISLTGDVDRETEQALQDRLERIAMRGDMYVFNWLQSWRDELASIRQSMALMISLLVLFFTVAVAMQVGAAGRRIRSDTRMIGTLRAVGADEKALLGCYRLPLLTGTAFGVLLGIAAYCAYIIWYNGITHIWLNAYAVIPLMLLLGVLCALCALAGTKARLKAVLAESIVENIREL